MKKDKKNINHKPVLLNESIDGLNIKPDGIYIDATFGSGGHSKIILSKLNKYGKLFVIDCDFESIKIAYKLQDKRIYAIHSKFSLLEIYMKKLNLLGKINGIILDLGISSIQLNNPKRGFSFINDGPLDGRMDTTQEMTAYRLINYSSEKKIFSILKNFGNEKFAKLISRKIFKQKKIKKIYRTTELSKIIIDSTPYWNKYKHPSRRTFQAIRIYVNNELEELKKILKSSILLLAPYGRLSIISFHSLEDKIVKNFINKNSKLPDYINMIPFTNSEIKKIILNKLIFKNLGKIKPSKKEIKFNPNSRSAILRIAEKLKK